MNAIPKSDDTLDFVLPDFTRYSWVSNKARLVWQPRLARISKAWSEIEWRSVLAEARSCSLTQVAISDYASIAGHWIEAGLSALPIQIEQRLTQSYASTAIEQADAIPNALRVAVGKPQDLALFKKAWGANDNKKIGQLLGYPDCCISFFQETWIDQHRVDTTWAMALNTNADKASKTGIAIKVNGPPEVNILWRWAGIRAVPHLPCRFDCEPTLHFANHLCDVGVELGFDAEINWIREILSWPVEWSALHGIAEIKTPILKISTRTDATAHKHVVQYLGRQYPKEGTSGLRFPYELPTRLLISDSKAFNDGLKQPLKEGSAVPDWQHLDNGFSARSGMDIAHQPIVKLASNEIAGVQGNIIDFGCGNGLLLKKICESRSGLIPYGIDFNKTNITHAKVLLPEFQKQFIVGDIFDIDIWPAIPRFVLGIFMIGRLLEVHNDHVEKFLMTIKERCARVLVYIYSKGNAESLEVLVNRFDLRLKYVDGKNVGFLDMNSIKSKKTLDASAKQV